MLIEQHNQNFPWKKGYRRTKDRIRSQIYIQMTMTVSIIVRDPTKKVEYLSEIARKKKASTK